jgi:hypothetical protein
MSCTLAPSPTEQRSPEQRSPEHPALRSVTPDPAAVRSQVDLLLDRARRVGVTGHGWATLKIDAVRQTRRLADDGAVPSHLVVESTDPPVVVERSLRAVSRHLDRLYAGPGTGRSVWESIDTADV